MKYTVELNGKRYEVEVEESEVSLLSITDAPVTAPVMQSNASTPVASEDKTEASTSVTDGMPVKAPMPGAITNIKASKGQSVKAGDIILIMEAMKMENEVIAPVAGKILEILVSKGGTVNTDDVLAVIG